MGRPAQDAFLTDLASGAFHVEWGAEDDLERAHALHVRYPALGLCLVDAVVMAVAERLDRVAFSVPLADWLDAAAHPRSVRVVPITTAIATGVAAPPPTFPRDPADRLIVASSRVLGVPLLTRDARILRARLVARWTGHT